MICLSLFAEKYTYHCQLTDSSLESNLVEKILILSCQLESYHSGDDSYVDILSLTCMLDVSRLAGTRETVE